MKTSTSGNYCQHECVKKLCNKNGWIQLFRFVVISRLQTAWWCPSKRVELSFSSLNPALRKKTTTVTTKSLPELCLEAEKLWFEEPTIGVHACKPSPHLSLKTVRNCCFSRFEKILGLIGSRNIFKCWIFLRTSAPVFLTSSAEGSPEDLRYSVMCLLELPYPNVLQPLRIHFASAQGFYSSRHPFLQPLPAAASHSGSYDTVSRLPWLLCGSMPRPCQLRGIKHVWYYIIPSHVNCVASNMCDQAPSLFPIYIHPLH